MIKLIGFYDYTVILTYLNLVFSIIGMVLSSHRMFTSAVCFLLFSGVCDAFDGIVARSKKNRTEDEKAFGIQIDSLCDAVSFGVAPAFLCFFLGMNGPMGITILILFCLCGVIRLAFFNVMEEKRQKQEGGCNKTYRGLPITSSSIILPLVYLLRFILPNAVFVTILHIIMGLMGFLFVLDFSVKKPDWIGFLKRAHSPE
ncbi:MAG: CDP-alcohol phosphatidyltransferase family protein [Faecousia sp.]